MFEEKELTFRELAGLVGVTDLDNPTVYDVSDKNIEISSYNIETKQEEWKPMTSFVVKDNSSIHYQLGSLKGTPKHRVYWNGEWTTLETHPEAKLVQETIQVVDCQVEDNHNYMAEGQINHNTTVPGGKALPYNASIRIKLGGGAQIKKTVDGEERVIGVSVTANIIKNRMSAPFRKVEFEIHFGKGIKEHEQVFDYLRTWCDKHQDTPAKLGDVKITISGTGAWKELNLSNIVTGEVLDTVKFYKADFANILYNPKYKKEMTALMDAAYLWTSDEEEHLTLGEVLPEEAIEDPLTIST